MTSYAQVFTLYDNQQVLFAAEQNFSDKNIVSVKTQIVMPGRDNIDVSFKVRINKKTKEWKAYDMVCRVNSPDSNALLGNTESFTIDTIYPFSFLKTISRLLFSFSISVT